MATAASKPSQNFLNALSRSPDLIMAVSIIGIVLMMIFPLPAFFLDFLLAISISISIIILLVSVYISKPLEFGVFPTLLLICTLFRLGLNIATTRNILLHGADGEVSHLVIAFGSVVVGGNFVVGLVVFIILMIINFIVITKGAGRVAEVAARFTLDAMPGKQMAIDAELNSGHITTDEAKTRRKNIENEADFYGAMDGASKFVRGDAIAAIIITLVNVVVGFIIGLMMYNMSPQESVSKFTLYAIGDGLISAIPALMISTAAGIIITRATSEGNLGQEVINQVRLHPKAFYLTGALILMLALIPGFPKLSFFILASVLILLGRVSSTWAVKKAESEKKHDAEGRHKDDKDGNNLEDLMKVDIVAIEVGHGIISLIDPAQDGEVIERIQGIRKQLAQELGIIIPQVQLRDNLQLEPGAYQILLKGNRIAGGNLMVDYYMAMDPGNVELPLELADNTKDPVYGLPALWVHKRDKDEAVFRGYTVVNCATIIATHLTKVLKENSAELITRQEIYTLVERLRETNGKVVEEVIQAERLNLGDIVKVMQNLLHEEVSVRDILSLFECLADHCKLVKNPDVLSEQCRKALGRQIVHKLLNEKEELAVVTFDRLIEDILAGGLVITDNGSSYLNMDARQAQEILNRLLVALRVFDSEGSQPALLISSRLRQPFQKLASRYVPQLAVLSYDEVPAGTNIKNLELITLNH